MTMTKELLNMIRVAREKGHEIESIQADLGRIIEEGWIPKDSQGPFTLLGYPFRHGEITQLNLK